MNRKNIREIESQLERSLRSQVRAPKLDGRFDAAVWGRIENSAVPAGSAPRKMPRWLLVSNIFGVVVAIALIAIVGGEAMSSVEVSVELPQVAPGFVARVVDLLAWPVTAAALLYGVMFTGIGRRLRSDFF